MDGDAQLLPPTKPAQPEWGAPYAPAPTNPRPGDDPFGRERPPLLKRIASGVAVVIALIVKFAAKFKALVFLLPKVKLLSTAGTALVSIAAYSLFWGWQFAVGFVALLFVHEMGHVIQLRREGIKASAPMFIPFLGAVVAAKSLGENALAEARVGLAGPVLGTLGALACVPLYLATGNQLFLALAYFGFFINLFNLMPVVPLDGGRAMAAMAPWMWFVGFAGLIAVAFIFPNPIMVVFILIGGFETWRRWKQRRSQSLEDAAYYRVAPLHRALVAAVYIGLIVALAFGMYETYIHKTL